MDTKETKPGIWSHMPKKIGMRNIKTATAAALCALVYSFFDHSPAFACIGAIFGMGSSLENSKLNGGNRFFGTIIGGLIGMALFRFHLIFYPEGGITWLLIPLVFIGTVVLILLCQTFWVGGIQPGGVVLCIVLFNTPVESYVSYALFRMFDTGVGVLAALVVNSLFPGGMTFEWFWGLYSKYKAGKDALDKPHLENVTHLAVEMSHEMEETLHFHSHPTAHHLHKHIHSQEELEDASQQAVEMAWEMQHPHHLDKHDHTRD